MFAELAIQAVFLVILAVFDALFVLEFIKTPRIKNKAVCALIFFACGIFPYIYNCFINTSETVYDIIAYTLGMMAYIIPIVIISKDNFKRKLLVFVEIFSLFFLCELLTEMLVALIFEKGVNYTQTHPTVVFYFRVFSTIIFIFCLASVIIIHKHRKSKLAYQIVSILTLIPITEFLHIWMLLRGYKNMDSAWGWFTGVLLLIMLSLISLSSIYFLRKSERLRQQEQQYEAMRIMRRDDERYYALIQNEVAKSTVICQEIGNQIQQIETLLAQKDKESSDTARRLLFGITDKVAQLRALKFCENNLANTILTIENDKLLKANVEFEVKAVLPNKLNIADLDLSSILSNILDNAIEAALMYQEQHQETKNRVSFNMGIRDERLIIKVTNPTIISAELSGIENFTTTKENSNKYHGYGIKILSEVAQRYDGDYVIATHNNLCESILVLNNISVVIQ